MALTVLSGCSTVTQNRAGAAHSVRLAYRIIPVQWETDQQFARLMDLMKANKAAVDEISLFDQTFPPNADRAD
jgi:hypothetical protein